MRLKLTPNPQQRSRTILLAQRLPERARKNCKWRSAISQEQTAEDAIPRKRPSGCGDQLPSTTTRLLCFWRISICAETASPRIAIKPACCCIRQHARACREPETACGISKPLVVSKKAACRPQAPLGPCMLMELLRHQDRDRDTLSGLVPECQFDAVPEAELIVNNSQVVLYDVLGRANGFGNLLVF